MPRTNVHFLTTTPLNCSVDFKRGKIKSEYVDGEEFTQLCMTKLQPRIKQISQFWKPLYIKPYKQQKRTLKTDRVTSFQKP